MLLTIVGVALLGTVLWDAFETIVLPRSVTHRIGMTRMFYRGGWGLWQMLGRLGTAPARRDGVLSFFGPLSLIVLLAIWATCIITSFAMIYQGLGLPTSSALPSHGFGSYLYMSGVTLFTLGFGDVVPASGGGRGLAVIEAGTGMGLLAMVIGYLPVLYQAFSRREVGISLLDARAGSPPTAAELLRRHVSAGCMGDLTNLLREWERWSAELLESHLSYPVLTFYRSQHDRESWLAALTAMLDACALARLGFAGRPEWEPGLRWQAGLTFAMARHAVVDLALILGIPPAPDCRDRLPAGGFAAMQALLAANGLILEQPDAEERLRAMREQYEPFVIALAQRLSLELPPWMPAREIADNWETSAWGVGHLVS